ncbi:MAG: hypothetical protein IJG13_02255 [Kiritimatiellae bacterium]|nr:hypothetical protein [Kiritimatiellia bacterium]MBQ6328820.1 hypothetical protein [Kiritimatiellia bacterium]
MAKYFVEYGALQANAKRLIECDTSANPPVKITEDFAREIADALNNHEAGASLDYIPSQADLDALEEHAKYMQDHSIYGGGVLLSMIADYRKLLADRQKTISGMVPGNQQEET